MTSAQNGQVIIVNEIRHCFSLFQFENDLLVGIKYLKLTKHFQQPIDNNRVNFDFFCSIFSNVDISNIDFSSILNANMSRTPNIVSPKQKNKTFVNIKDNNGHNKRSTLTLLCHGNMTCLSLQYSQMKPCAVHNSQL